ncbi:MAG: hypothetical protein AAFR46_08350 [Pseudomonadota bacterium]
MMLDLKKNGTSRGVPPLSATTLAVVMAVPLAAAVFAALAIGLELGLGTTALISWLATNVLLLSVIGGRYIADGASTDGRQADGRLADGRRAEARAPFWGR